MDVLGYTVGSYAFYEKLSSDWWNRETAFLAQVECSPDAENAPKSENFTGSISLLEIDYRIDACSAAIDVENSLIASFNAIGWHI